jgi:hypothetical protein
MNEDVSVGGDVRPSALVLESERVWPSSGSRVAARPYLPCVGDLLKAFVWRVGGESSPDPGTVGEGDPSVRELLAETLFPTPWRAETEYEVRCLLARVQVGDGLWSSFKLGAPFDVYRTPGGERVYSDDQASDLGRMFEDAYRSVGPVRLYELACGLVDCLLLPT